MARTKVRAANMCVPQSREELARFVQEIGEAQREIVRIEAAMNDDIAARKREGEADAVPFAQRVRELTEGARIYCEAHRLELTDNLKVKHFETGVGKIEWRNWPPSVRLNAGWKLEDVIARLKKLRLPQFIRVKEELDKEAILSADSKEVARIEGVRVASAGEDFIVTPFEAAIEGAGR